MAVPLPLIVPVIMSVMMSAQRLRSGDSAGA
jgi:hypothetical protein